MNIALVHDGLDTWRGGESVLAEFCRIYPEADLYALVDFLGQADRGGTYVTVSQLVPYKRVDLIVEAFRSLPDRELIVIGEGPENARIQAMAGSNVRLLGRVPDPRFRSEFGNLVQARRQASEARTQP